MNPFRRLFGTSSQAPADGWQSDTGKAMLSTLWAKNPALAAEVERGRARKAKADDFPSLVTDPIIQLMARECAAIPDLTAMADPNGNPLPGFARAALADYKRRGGDRATTPDGVAKALIVLVGDTR